MTMLAPASASPRTTALPMPLLPPVTMATLPLSVMSLFLGSWPAGGVVVLLRPDQFVRDSHQLTDGVHAVARATADDVGDEAGPAGLVRGPEARTVVAVEVLVEDEIVLP